MNTRLLDALREIGDGLRDARTVLGPPSVADAPCDLCDSTEMYRGELVVTAADAEKVRLEVLVCAGCGALHIEAPPEGSRSPARARQ